MKQLRALVVLGLASATFVLALRWRPVRTGFTTPVECLDAYRDARAAGDGETFLTCLGEPLRSETRRRFPDSKALADFLARDSREVKGWVELDAPTLRDAEALVDVEEVRPAGQRRLHFRLTRSAEGWLIVGIDPAQELAPAVPYGTHVRETPDDPQPDPDAEKSAMLK